MTYADLLLHIDTYPTPTTPAAIDEAVARRGQPGRQAHGSGH